MNQDQIKEPLESPKGKLRKINFSKVLETVRLVRNLILSVVSRGRQTKLGLIIMILVPVLVIASISIPLLLREKEGAGEKEGTAVFEKTGKLGDLEISILKATEGSYSTFEVVEGEAQRVQQKYYTVYTRVFNPSNTEKITFSSIKLVDDLGKEYQQDIPTLFDLRSSPQGFKEFGMDMVMYPRVIREGNVVFPAIAEGAKKLKMVFETETGEQAMFEFAK